MNVVTEVEGVLFPRALLIEGLQDGVEHVLLDGLDCAPHNVKSLMDAVGQEPFISPWSYLERIVGLGRFSLDRQRMTVEVLQHGLHLYYDQVERRRLIGRRNLPPWVGQCHSNLGRLPGLAHDRGGKFVAISAFPWSLITRVFKFAGLSGSSSSDGLYTMEDEARLHNCFGSLSYEHRLNALPEWAVRESGIPKDAHVNVICYTGTGLEFATHNLELHFGVGNVRPLLHDDDQCSVLSADNLIRRLLKPPVDVPAEEDAA